MDDCGSTGRDLMDADAAADLAGLFKALSDPTRVRIVAYLAQAADDTVCACHLPDGLGVSQPTLSHHLSRLVRAGLLSREQRGRWAHYAVVPQRLDAATAYLTAAGRR